MPTIDLTDDEAANLAALLDVMLGPKAMPFLATIGGAVATIRAKIVTTKAATFDGAKIRETLGRFAATQATVEEVATLRTQIDAYLARDLDAREAMALLGVDMTSAGPFAKTAFTNLARQKLGA